MLSDLTIKTGDLVRVTMAPPAIVPPLLAPAPLVGSCQEVTVHSMPVCVEGDELPPVWKAPMPYTAPPYVTPGMGTLTLRLAPANKTAQTSAGDKPLLIRGTPFIAEFQVTTPATMPTPGGPVPDPLPKKTGTAEFVTTNVTTTAG